ncbi:MAG: hypothetical protein QOH72_4755 [Solirubrobacteraceae bacterium]|jgi:hypothetical protein|nr:hypothetical protein [Solirubrobacteraceae bacterium]
MSRPAAGPSTHADREATSAVAIRGRAGALVGRPWRDDVAPAAVLAVERALGDYRRPDAATADKAAATVRDRAVSP